MDDADDEAGARALALQHATRQAEAAERRLTLLARGAAQLAATATPHDALARLARLVAAEVAAWCVVEVVGDDGGWSRAAVARRHPSGYDPVPSRADPRVAARMDEVFTRVLETGVFEFLTLGGAHSAVVAIPARPRGIGVVVLGAMPGEPFDASDIAVVEPLAHLCGVACANAADRQRWKTRLRERDAELAAASHDLRNLASSTALSAGVAVRQLRAGDADEALRMAEQTERVATTLQLTLSTLLEVARADGGQAAGQPLPQSLVAIVDEALDVVAPLVAAKQLRVERPSAARAVTVRGDRVQLVRVVSNLLANAVTFSPEGASIGVVLRIETGRAELLVRDRGPGIRADVMPRLFERYWRGGGAESGAGLGLYIVRQLVEAHGGGVRVESQPGAGSTFIVSLPLDEAPLSIGS